MLNLIPRLSHLIFHSRSFTSLTPQDLRLHLSPSISPTNFSRHHYLNYPFHYQHDETIQVFKLQPTIDLRFPMSHSMDYEALKPQLEFHAHYFDGHPLPSPSPAFSFFVQLSPKSSVN